MRHSALRSRPVAAVGLVLVLALVVPVADASPGDPVAAARERVAAATEDRRAAEAHLEQLRRDHEALAAEVAELGEAEQALTRELTDTRRQMREFAVEAYIDGGQSELFRSTLSIDQAQALAWQASISARQADAAAAAAHRYRTLRDATTPQRLEAAAKLDELDERIVAAGNDLIQAAAHERDAEAALAAEQAAAARRAEEQRAAEREARQRVGAQPAVSRGSAPAATGSAPAATGGHGARGNPTQRELQILAKIRRCESGGNYSITNPSGRYRGAYQFDRATWQSVGGSGDPAAAAPAEQDYRALLLLRSRGTRPWPHCGR